MKTINGGGDITPQLQNLTPGTEIHITGPASTYNALLVFDGIHVLMDDDATLQYVGPIVPGAASIRHIDTSGQIGGNWTGGYLIGPGSQAGPYVAGRREPNMAGISRECQGLYQSLRGQFWDWVVEGNCTSGHLGFRDCEGGNNYYWYYNRLNTGGPGFEDCRFAGQYMAMIGLDPIQGCNKLTVRDTQGGFSPFVIFQEPLDQIGLNAAGCDGTFLGDCEFENFNFEQVGNGAFVSDTIGEDGSGNHRGCSQGWRMTDCGCTWDTTGTYVHPGHSRDYLIKCDVMRGEYDAAGNYSGPGVIVENDEANPLCAPPGGPGVFAFNQCPDGIVSVDGVRQNAWVPHGPSLIVATAQTPAPQAATA